MWRRMVLSFNNIKSNEVKALWTGCQLYVVKTCGTIGVTSDVEKETPLSENDIFSSEFINRNPRNLEQMFLARKPSGFGLDHPSRKYWNNSTLGLQMAVPALGTGDSYLLNITDPLPASARLHLYKSSRNTTAKVMHNNGKTVVTASTAEWAISKQLYSNTDVSAAKSVGSVLARRCLESGILFLHCEFTPEELATNRVQAFLTAMEEGGVTLKEPEQIRPRLHPDL